MKRCLNFQILPEIGIVLPAIRGGLDLPDRARIHRRGGHFHCCAHFPGSLQMMIAFENFFILGPLLCAARCRLRSVCSPGRLQRSSPRRRHRRIQTQNGQ